MVWFWTGDTVVPQGALARMVALMNEQRHANVGALGPLLKNADGSIQMSFGNMLSLSAELHQKILNAGYGNGRGIRVRDQKPTAERVESCVIEHAETAKANAAPIDEASIPF